MKIRFLQKLMIISGLLIAPALYSASSEEGQYEESLGEQLTPEEEEDVKALEAEIAGEEAELKHVEHILETVINHFDHDDLMRALTRAHSNLGKFKIQLIQLIETKRRAGKEPNAIIEELIKFIIDSFGAITVESKREAEQHVRRIKEQKLAYEQQMLKNRAGALHKEASNIDMSMLSEDQRAALMKDIAALLFVSPKPLSSAELDAIAQRLHGFRTSIEQLKAARDKASSSGLLLPVNLKFLTKGQMAIIHELTKTVPTPERVLAIDGQLLAIANSMGRASGLLNQAKVTAGYLTEKEIIALIIAGIEGGKDDKAILTNINKENERTRELQTGFGGM